MLNSTKTFFKASAAQLRGAHTSAVVHSTAVKGFTAEGAALYNAGRPTYPKESLDRTIEVLYSRFPDREKSTILELGAGTGKFASTFLDYSKTAAVAEAYPAILKMRYVATEPSDGFRESLAQTLSKKHPEVEVGTALGASIPFEQHSLDGIVVAQAFHWMATTDTLKEVHRVLTPYSPLVLIWNSYDYSYDWLRKMDELVLSKAYTDDVPRQQTGKWEDCFNTEVGRNLFSMVHKWQGNNFHQGDENLIVGRIMSTSVIAEKTEAEKQEIEKVVRNIIATHPELEESRKTGLFTVPYITQLAWANSNA